MDHIPRPKPEILESRSVRRAAVGPCERQRHDRVDPCPTAEAAAPEATKATLIENPPAFLQNSQPAHKQPPQSKPSVENRKKSPSPPAIPPKPRQLQERQQRQGLEHTMEKSGVKGSNGCTFVNNLETIRGPVGGVKEVQGGTSSDRADHSRDTFEPDSDSTAPLHQRMSGGTAAGDVDYDFSPLDAQRIVLRMESLMIDTLVLLQALKDSQRSAGGQLKT
ncbi:MAG: hypothetical protein Q9188_002313 [Gyalolechia gomerana]